MRNTSGCPASLLQDAKSLIESRGLADLRLGSGEHTHQLRCIAFGGRLVLLIHSCQEILIPDGDDVPGCVLIEHSGASGDLEALVLAGWLSRVPRSQRLPIADAFATRHFTTDLLDLDGDWMLATLEVSEARYGTSTASFSIDTDGPLAFLLA